MVVTDVSNPSVRDLTARLIHYQKEKGYAQSAIERSITFAKRLSRFMNERGFSNYTESIGSEFKKEMRKVYATGKFQMIQLFISRLDAIHQNRGFLDFRKTLAPIELPSELEMLCSAYMEHCRRKGNRKSTLEGNYKACRIFLRGLCEKGVFNIRDIDASTISAALLCLKSEGYVKTVQRFLHFLFQEGYLNRDYSYIVPKFKYPNPIPSVYSIEEIRQIEAAVGRSTPRGKRDYAIILSL